MDSLKRSWEIETRIDCSGPHVLWLVKTIVLISIVIDEIVVLNGTFQDPSRTPKGLLFCSLISPYPRRPSGGRRGLCSPRHETEQRFDFEASRVTAPWSTRMIRLRCSVYPRNLTSCTLGLYFSWHFLNNNCDKVLLEIQMKSLFQLLLFKTAGPLRSSFYFTYFLAYFQWNELSM